MIAYCATCKEDAIMNDSGVCSWCGTKTRAEPAQKKHHGGVGPGPVWLTERQLRDAHAAHVAGESLNSIAKRLVGVTRYRSRDTVLGALSSEWRRRGWYVRDRVEATVKASTIHGRAPRDHRLRDPEYKRELRRKTGLLLDRPLCAALTVRGEPCQRRALADAPLCYTHQHPDHAERMRSVRRPRERVWLVRANRAVELRAAGLKWREIADQLGYAGPASAQRMARMARQAVAS